MHERIELKANDFRISGILARACQASESKLPLLVAIHGGSYTAAYFDVPGYSLLSLAASQGLMAVSLDRPSYGQSDRLPRGIETIANSAALLSLAIDDLWAQFGEASSGVVLIGHSVGAAVAVTMAASRAPRSWPLSGIALSGTGVVAKTTVHQTMDLLPKTDPISSPDDLKEQYMFGPAGTFSPDAPAVSRISYHTVPKTEIFDISRNWEHLFPFLGPLVKVPVQYRVGEHDGICHTGEDQIAAVESVFGNSSRVDAAIERDAGHSIDLHLCGAAFQQRQIDFALSL